jgi:preprotein translocase SecE subunit
MASQAVTAEPPRRLRVARRRAGAPFRALDSVFRYLGKYKIFRIVGYVIVLPYFRNSWKELEGVTWTKWRESLRLTSAVFAFALVFGIVIAIVDYGLDKVFKQVLLK